MINTNREVNAGVHANIGMDFQKNCTIYLFLDKYNDLKNKRYFIILEHLEDIVFGFLDNETELSKIETYQAKKSSVKWTIGNIVEIVNKITKTSQSILDDPHPKIDRFLQKNYFITNNTIELKCKVNSQYYGCTINESTETYKYVDLDQNLKDKLLKGNSEVTFTSQNIANLKNLNFRYIDLGRTTHSQLEQLNGKFVTVFGDRILDHKAALYSFFYALDKIERELNQGNVAYLNDNKKRIESTEIDEIIKILTKKKMSFEFWRKKGETICEELNISISDKNTFELHYQNSFDKFKDLTQSEHNKIYHFVRDNKHIFSEHTTDKACISGFLNAFNKEKSTTLQNLQLKAIIAAAYVEIKDTL